MVLAICHPFHLSYQNMLNMMEFKSNEFVDRLKIVFLQSPNYIFILIIFSPEKYFYA